MDLRAVSGSVTNNIISSNTLTGCCAYDVDGFGGGIYAEFSHLFISGNTITGNTLEATSGFGGGVACAGGTAVIAGNLIAGNRLKTAGGFYSLAQGAGVYLGGVSAVVVNNTVAFNTVERADANIRGSGIFVHDVEGDLGSVEAVNNIIAFNSSGLEWEGPVPVLRHNDVHGNGLRNYPAGADLTGTAGNLNKAPLFIDPEGGDFRLLPLSPTIDAGDDLAVRTPLDLDGRARLQGAHVDMGAYEAAVNPTLTIADARRALAIAAGMEAATSFDRSRLDLYVDRPNAIDIRDALRVARRVFGRDTNP